MRRHGTLCAAVAAVGLTVSGCSTDLGRVEVTESGLTRLAVDYSPTAVNAQLTLGVNRGIFADHGLEIVQVPGAGASAASVALLLNGQIQLAVSEITAIPTAVAAGFPIEVVTSLATDYRSPQGDAFSVVVADDSPIRSFADLPGHTVAVNGLRSFFDLTVLESVRRSGGDPDRVSVVAVPFEDQVAALRQGRVDAVSTLEPFAGQLLRSGFRTLGNPATTALGPRSVATVLMGSKEFVDRNPEVMHRFLAALQEATEYANNHPAEVRQTISDTTGAPPETVAALPVPWFITGIERRAAALTTRLMVDYGRIDSAPEVDDFTWSQSPDATDVANPPRDLQVTG
ncbi:ABC transporter substrate-binding protein [Mycolicibacterium diernhoferi]|nr:ABC transporter substrate-binding protein [Mycolicibacterium diernhoferi]QYL22090.1 ABC transporter substrate-binding protein [Mycolicibacterium diernhoferi]